MNLGSQALAMPLPLFWGNWAFSENRNRWSGKLMEFAEYLEATSLFIQLDISRFREDLSQGMYFESNIPTGYGAGSSGALVAAIFDRYCMVREGKDLKLLKKTLAQMEGFFHGTSSGTDPLICYLNSAVVLNTIEIKKIELPKMESPYTLFLLNTGMERQATPFIEYFLKKNKEAKFSKKIKSYYLPTVDTAIEYFLKSKWDLLFNQFNLISEFQFLNLEKMIPGIFLEIWNSGLNSNYFKLKICGAGGGGFILGMTNDFENLKNDFKEFNFIKI